MALRRATELRARELFSALGGRPERSSPHYFVLGESAWFAGLYDEAEQVRLPLARLPVEVTSFTGTDSISALGLGERLGVPVPTDPRRRRLYRLDQLAEVGAVHEWLAAGAVDYDGHQFRPLETYVEVQLWSDRPVADFLTGPVAEPLVDQEE
jgi:hypothetical protein